MPAPKTVKFKIHEDKEGKTIDLNLRIAVIDNGFVIKAGGPPFFCADEEALKKAVDGMMSQFLEEMKART